jgi:hypothetical protein
VSPSSVPTEPARLLLSISKFTRSSFRKNGLFHRSGGAAATSGHKLGEGNDLPNYISFFISAGPNFYPILLANKQRIL